MNRQFIFNFFLVSDVNQQYSEDLFTDDDDDLMMNDDDLAEPEILAMLEEVERKY